MERFFLSCHRPKKADSQAQAVAAARALLDLDPPFSRIVSDPYAQLFLSGKWKLLYAAFRHLPQLRRFVFLHYERIANGMITWPAVRHAFFDDFIVSTIPSTSRQLVILGSGYDTRAIRLGDQLANARIFEVDRHSVIDRKISILNQNGISNPLQVFVPTDLSNTRWAQDLLAHGFDTDQSAVFLLEGLLSYLDETAVDNMWCNLSLLCSVGGKVAFDYIDNRYLTCERFDRNAFRHIAFVAKQGEPLRSGFRPSLLSDFLFAHGFILNQHRKSEELRHRLVGRYAGQQMHAHCRIAVGERSVS